MVTVNPDSGVGTQTGGRLAEHGMEYESDRLVREPSLMGRSYVSWGAVIAGALTAISLLILSDALAYACGVPAYTGGTFGWGAGIWMVVTAFIVFLIGGGVIGYFTPYTEQANGALHGLMAWVLAVPLMLIFTGAALGFLHIAGANGMFHSTLTPGSAYQPTWGTQTGAAWGMFISLAVGLIGSAIGGSMSFMGKATMPRTH